MSKKIRNRDIHRYISRPAYCNDNAVDSAKEKYVAEWTPGASMSAVRDRRHIEELWYGGCYGRGNLSRSQPRFMIPQNTRQVGAEKETEEHLILCRLETVYLSWYLKCLDIKAPSESAAHFVDAYQFWRLNALISMMETEKQHRSAAITTLIHKSLNSASGDWRNSRLSLAEKPELTIAELKQLLCNEFIISYAVYHYYRSVRGLVVRRGIKYGCDLVLYERGPVFQHACQAVLIMEGDDLNEISSRKPKINWFDVSTHVRVLGNVKKQFLLCYVSLSNAPVGGSINEEDDDDAEYWLKLVERVYSSPEGCLECYQISEVELGRWVPEKTRD